MIKPILILTGFLLLLFQQFIMPIPVQLQYSFFLTGIVLLGVPHGAADLLIATQNAADNKRSFSTFYFFLNYLSRLILFAAMLWFFPLAGNLLFILFAAYHFGETDLHQFNTRSIVGKLFVVSYGLVILGVILLHHFQSVKPLFQMFAAGIQYAPLINFIEAHQYQLLFILGGLFFVSTGSYFFIHPFNKAKHLQFLINFILIVFILYNLPMIIGFTFYFVVWHSFLSLKNIVRYLRKDALFTAPFIIKQIAFYSIVAIAGIALFGLMGFMFINMSAIMGYVFLGLAVLTAPHMQVMHNMYNTLRAATPGIKQLPL